MSDVRKSGEGSLGYLGIALPRGTKRGEVRLASFSFSHASPEVVLEIAEEVLLKWGYTEGATRADGTIEYWMVSGDRAVTLAIWVPLLLLALLASYIMFLVQVAVFTAVAVRGPKKYWITLKATTEAGLVHMDVKRARWITTYPADQDSEMAAFVEALDLMYSRE